MTHQFFLWLSISGQGPIAFRPGPKSGQLRFRDHVGPKTGLQDGGDPTRKFTHKITILD